jgi:cell division protein ZapA
MADISIKLKIADREYPMRVNASEEEIIRKAGKVLNERIKAYQDKYRIDDKQDLLAMVAFDCWMEKNRQETEHQDNDTLVGTKLAQWDTMLAQLTGDLA